MQISTYIYSWLLFTTNIPSKYNWENDKSINLFDEINDIYSILINKYYENINKSDLFK